jgi:hypothetical protein
MASFQISMRLSLIQKDPKSAVKIWMITLGVFILRV